MPREGAKAERTRQGVLTVGKRRAAAYLSKVRALFSFKPSDRCFAPSAPTLLFHRLRARAKNQTSAGADGRETVRGSVLERLEGGVGLQRLGDVLGALCTELVVTQTAIESKTQTSGGIDTWGKGVRRRT